MKNHQPLAKIKEMVRLGLGASEVQDCVELTAGFCNVAYYITQEDGTKSILKIASPDENSRMRNENCLMENEVSAMQLAKDKISCKIPEVYFYDDSCKICTGPYFFMEVVPGADYWTLREELSNEEKTEINFTVGNLVKEISEIKGTYFGSLGNPDARFKTLYEWVSYMLKNVVLDAEDKNIDYFISKTNLFSMLEKDKPCFDEFTNSCLVHYDLWEGNIFICNKKISGIIDWERAMFGDPLMEDRFRRGKCSQDFVNGYSERPFTRNEKRRLLWYDIILFLSMMNEGSFRNYPDDSTYNYAMPLYKCSLEELNRTPSNIIG